jgi:hypothetical protein
MTVASKRKAARKSTARRSKSNPAARKRGRASALTAGECGAVQR